VKGWQDGNCAAPTPRRISWGNLLPHEPRNRQQDICRDDVDRQDFLKTLAGACQKTGFQVHACCLMRHRFHLVVETPLAIRQIAKRRRIGSGKSRNNKLWLRRKIKPKES